MERTFDLSQKKESKSIIDHESSVDFRSEHTFQPPVFNPTAQLSGTMDKAEEKETEQSEINDGPEFDIPTQLKPDGKAEEVEEGEEIENNELNTSEGIPPSQLRKNNKSGAEETGGNVSNGNSGLPFNLKSGIESLSGYSMDDVNVHYNSSQPSQLQAHAFAQGTNIHIGPGQEKHLPHEAWHVVQQKQGRVKPTVQLKPNVSINDNKNLEREADMMGGKAQEFGSQNNSTNTYDLEHQNIVQAKVIQRDYDDQAKINNFDNIQLTRFWTKLKNGEGGSNFPNLTNKPKDSQQTYLQIIQANLNGQNLTEREAVEAISNIPQIRDILVGPRLHSFEDGIEKDKNQESVIKKVIHGMMYYHATYDGDAATSIFENGLSIKKAGKGEGASTHARSGAASADSQKTYNKWSKGFIFITPLKSEAETYARKMSENNDKKKTKILHVFCDPDWAVSDAFADVDSKAGLKVDGNVKNIGDGSKLNSKALSLIKNWANHFLGDNPAENDKIQNVYASMK